MNKLLLGIAGRARSGKSTCASILCQALELRAYAIALPVTQACAAALGIEHQAFLRLPKKAPLLGWELTKRELMQTIGDALISKNPHALLTNLEHRMEREQSAKPFFNGELISDIRTETEAEWLRSKGGLLIHIHRETQEESNHRTETDLHVLPQDTVITNFKTQNFGTPPTTIEIFRNKCELLVDHILFLNEKAS